MANKGVIAVGAAVIAVGTIWLLAKGAGAAPDDLGEGTIDIVIIGPDGQPVPQV